MIPADISESRERTINTKAGLCQHCMTVLSSVGMLDSNGFFERIEVRCPTHGVVYELNRGTVVPPPSRMPAICR